MMTFNVPDGQFGGYLAVPAGGTGPGLVIAQEIFGVNSVMRETAERYAAAGYLALVPDLFWRIEPGIELDAEDPVQLERAFQLYGQFDEDRGVADLQVALAALADYPGCTGKVGTVGYCLGGKLTYLMATRSDAECNVSYYGVGIERSLDEADQISTPLLLHRAGEDQFAPLAVQTQIQERLVGESLTTLYEYPGQPHAFARLPFAPESQTAAELAQTRTLAFLTEHLS